MTRMDGRDAAEFDVIDRFVVAHGLDLEARTRGDGPRRSRAGPHARRRQRAARRARPALARPHAGEAGARHRPPRPGRAHARAQEAARASRPRQPGARHEPEGEPSAPRGRCRGGVAARLRGDGDDRGRRAVCAAERDRAPRRLADRSTRRHDAVRSRGAAQPRARDPWPCHLCGDAVRLRHGARFRRRRRHAVVEGVPRGGVRVARSEGARSRRAPAPRR